MEYCQTGEEYSRTGLTFTVRPIRQAYIAPLVALWCAVYSSGFVDDVMFYIISAMVHHMYNSTIIPSSSKDTYKMLMRNAMGLVHFGFGSRQITGNEVKINSQHYCIDSNQILLNDKHLVRYSSWVAHRVRSLLYKNLRTIVVNWTS